MERKIIYFNLLAIILLFTACADKQSIDYDLFISNSNYEIEAEGGYIEIQYNISTPIESLKLSIHNPNDWIKIIDSERYGCIRLEILKNTGENRTGYIDIQYGEIIKNVKIHQKQIDKTSNFSITTGWHNYAVITLGEIIPDNLNTNYIVKVIPKTLFDQNGGSEKIGQYLQELWKEDPNSNSLRLYKGEYRPFDFFKDTDIALYWDNLKSDTEYVILVYYADQERNPLSKIEYLVIKTDPLPEKIDTEISFQILSVEDTYATLKLNSIDTSNPEIYFMQWSKIGLYDSDIFDKEMTDNEIANKIIEYFHQTYDFGLGESFGLSASFDEISVDYDNFCIPNYQEGKEYILAIFATYEKKLLNKPHIARINTSGNSKGNTNDMIITDGTWE